MDDTHGMYANTHCAVLGQVLRDVVVEMRDKTAHLEATLTKDELQVYLKRDISAGSPVQ